MVALVYMARKGEKATIMSTEIARSEKIPQRFLENILLELKNEGIVGSKLGKSGGYFLLKSPDKIKLLDIIDHFEGSIAMLYCVSEKSYKSCEFCKTEDSCKIRKVFKEVRENTFNSLKDVTIASLV